MICPDDSPPIPASENSLHVPFEIGPDDPPHIALELGLDDFLHVADQFDPDNSPDNSLHVIGFYDGSIEVGFFVLYLSGLVSVLCLFLLPSHL